MSQINEHAGASEMKLDLFEHAAREIKLKSSLKLDDEVAVVW